MDKSKLVALDWAEGENILSSKMGPSGLPVLVFDTGGHMKRSFSPLSGFSPSEGLGRAQNSPWRGDYHWGGLLLDRGGVAASPFDLQ